MGHNKQKFIQSDYILREIFEDSYEHEVYFQLVNSIDISELCPSDIEVELSSRIKQPRLSFPDNDPRLVKVMIPISKNQNNPRKRAELRVKNFSKYAELVPKMRLSLKNQIAALKKDLVNEQEAILIDREVKRVREAGYKKIKLKLKKNIGNIQ